MDYLYGKLNKTVKTVDSKIIYIPGEFNEVDILNLYDTKEDGIYRIDSGLHGAELIIINKEHSLFRRINGEGDYSYDFINHEWIGLEGDISSISIDGVEQPVVNKNVDLPAYPTKTSLGLENVDNTSDATKKTNFTGSIADENTGFVTGGDAYTALSGKQATLVSGTNIKTINSNSLLGSGNINIASPFPSSWRTDSLAHLIVDVEADQNAIVGKTYLGEVIVDVRDGLFNGNAEFMINIMDVQSGDKVLWCIASSATVAPYHWETTFVGGQISPNGWTGYQPEINSSNKLSADLVDDSTATNKFVTATEKTEIASNTSARHTHSNKAILDNITAAYTTAEATKLSGIESGAQVNAPNTVIDANYVHTDNNFSDTYKGYVDANNAKVSNVQSDWNADSGAAQILNKPSVYTQSEVNDFLILNITAADIDVEHSTPDYTAIIPETAEKIKSFKYRLKVDARLVDPGAAEGIYVVGNPVQIMPIDFLTEFPNATLYSFETASAFFTVSLAVVSFLDVIIDNEHRLLIWGTEDAVIPRGITDDYNHTLSLSDGDSGAISSVQFNTINNQSVFGSGNIDVSQASSISYLTTAPTSANTDGLKFVVLSSEPQTKYNGYIYFITSSQN